MLRLSLLVVSSACFFALPSASAQQLDEQDPGRAFLTRAELEGLRDRFRAYSESPAYSPILRERARVEASQISERLSAGDFQAGDRVLVIVEGQEALSDTFMVGRGRVLQVGDLVEVRLSGVLRSEFRPHVEGELQRYIRRPRIQTESYLRIAVQGAITGPGFYTVPADIPLADAIMLAGGPNQMADLDNIRIERGPRRIWSGYPLQEALAGGMTVDQMRLRDGDKIVVPQRFSWGLTTIRTIAALLALPLSIAALLTLF